MRPPLTENEKQFLLAYWWETVHLEMNGPAHTLAKEHQVTEGVLAHEFSGCVELQSRFISGNMFDGPRIEPVEWPWVGRKLLPNQNTNRIEKEA